MRSFSILFIFLLFFSVESLAQTLTVESTFHSAGYYLNDLFSLSTKYSIQVKFKSDTSTTWRNALPPSDIQLNGTRKILGSILLLTPNTKYDLEVTIIDSFPTIHTLNLQAKFTTREEIPSSWTINNTLWVSPGGAGHEYTQSNPGNISTLLTTDQYKISCGTQVNCLGGVYHVGEFSLSLPVATSDCGDNPIIFTSAPGESAIFDGSDTSSFARQPAWILADSAQHIYTTILPSTSAWSTLLIYQGKRLFPYAFIYPQYLFGKVFNETLVNANKYFGSGFYHNGASFAIKLENGEDPNGKELIVSKFNSNTN